MTGNSESLIIRCGISLVAALILILSVWPKFFPLDLQTPQLILVCIALAPWFTEFIESIKIGQNSITTRVRENEKNIEYIAQLMRYVLTKNQMAFLLALYSEGSWVVGVPVSDKIGIEPMYQGFKNDALRLRGLGLVQSKRGGLSEMEKTPGECDATGYFQITDEGRAFLRIREKLDQRVQKA
jgi:hypothetical protein